MDPHTTSNKPRSCPDCHADPRALGLGSGSLFRQNAKWEFTPATAALSQSQGQGSSIPRLDGFVDISGRPLAHTSRKDLRPFNRKELQKILDAGQCISCHVNFKDRVMEKWNPASPPRPCSFSAMGRP